MVLPASINVGIWRGNEDTIEMEAVSGLQRRNTLFTADPGFQRSI